MRTIRLTLFLTQLTITAALEKNCHCLPEEPCWPGDMKWKRLNDTVEGRLVKVVPIGGVCHDPTYDQAKCTELQANWNEVETQLVATYSLTCG
jgi:hypothetical protein